MRVRPRHGSPPRPDKERPAGLHLPYARHLDDRVIVRRDGLLLSVLQLRGFPFETAETEEINYRKTLRDTMLRSLASSRFAVYQHVLRRETAAELPGEFPDAFSQAVDDIWRGRLQQKRLYQNDLFITLVRRPMQGRAGVIERVAGALLKGSGFGGQDDDLLQDARELQAATEATAAALAAYGAQVLSVYNGPHGPCSEPLEFLSELYHGEVRPVLLPTCDLGLYLPYRRVSFGRQAIEFASGGQRAREFAAIVSVKDYPHQTAAGMLDDILRLPFEMAVSQSFAFIDRQATLERMNLAIRRMRASDDEARSLRQELATAKDDTAAGRAAFGEHHLSIMVRAPSLGEVDEGVGELRSAFGDMGAVAVREDVNLEAAFWAQFPGNFRYIGRRAMISTANFAGLASGHSFPSGRARGTHWGGAVTVLETTAAGPYYFNFHKGDLGNFTVIGPSGSGKTVVLNFLLAQARRFNPRIIFFDKDRGAEVFMRAIGGRYEALRPGRASGLNPLKIEDTPANRRFLVEFVGCLLAADGERLRVEEVAQIKEAVDASFDQAVELRRLRYFSELLRGVERPGHADLAARLRPWWGDGEHAWLFDNDADTLDLTSRAIGFDMTRILDDPVCRTPAMLYLFHRIEERLDGAPTLIVIDEGWKALDDDVFVGRVRDWEKTIRKRNGLIGFCTQSAQDALQSRIASAIVEQSATHIFMANPKAREEDYCGGFGLTQQELAVVRNLPDHAHCFLIRHGQDSVVARLNLAGETDLLTVLSGRERTVRLLDELRDHLGEDPAVWLPTLLERA